MSKLDLEDGTWINYVDEQGFTWHIKKHPMFDNTQVEEEEDEDQGRQG